jgi:hypothetical protein
VTKTSITIEFDSDQLPGYTDTRLALLWHLVQANPADGFEHSQPGDLAAKVGWEIIRRWLRAAPIEMYRHQPGHYYWKQLSKFAIYRPGAEDFHTGRWEARAVPDDKELRDALAAKLTDLGAWAGNLSREQIAQELARIVLPELAGRDRAGEHQDQGDPARESGAEDCRGEARPATATKSEAADQ